MDRDTILQRVAKLERDNRILKLGAIGITALAACAFLMGFGAGDGGNNAQGRFEQIDSRHIVLRDTDGQMRAWLGIAEGGPRLIFFDQQGQQRLGVGMSRDGEPALGVFDGGENPRVVMGMVEGWPGLVFRDPSGKKRMAVYSREEWGSLFFYDRYETKRTGLGLYGDAATLNLCDDRGKDRTGLTSDHKGCALTFFDKLGQKRLGLGMILAEEPALGFFDKVGQVQMALSVLNQEAGLSLYETNRLEVAGSVPKTNLPVIRLFGADGQTVWHAP